MNNQNNSNAYNDHLILHFRMTKKCNADCSYCSSFETTHEKNATVENFKEGIEFLKEIIIKYGIGGSRDRIVVQYIGGEILILPTDFVEKITVQTKEILGPMFKSYRHGLQTNLIGNKSKIAAFYKIFDNNIGTSYDNFTSQKTINGDAEKYRTIFLRNLDYLKKNKKINPSGVVVLDIESSKFILDEIKIASENKRGLTIRPLFVGGKNQSYIEKDIFEKAMVAAYENWVLNLNSRIILEPFFAMLTKRVSNKAKTNEVNFTGCAFQHNCANVSVNIEPNGDIYICQDLAESKNFKLGNLFRKEFDEELFFKIQQRGVHLEQSCYSCDYFKECQGGCMKEAIDHGGDMYGKTEFCSTWKILFKKIDEDIEKYGLEKIKTWLMKLDMLATSVGEK